MSRVGLLLLTGLVALLASAALTASGGATVGSDTWHGATEHDDHLPVWSPDGRYIAFAREIDTNDSVFIVAVKSRAQRRLVADGDFPSWSPDGSRIAYSNLDGLWTIKIDRSGRKRVASDGDQPVWSPDGRSILFWKIGPGDMDGSWLYVVPAAGGKTRRVATPGDNGDWSPDSAKIAFDTGSLMLGSIPRVGVVGRDGRSLRTFGVGENPDWSPDGREIAFTGGSEDARNVSVMRSDGSNVRALADGEGPRFSPEGTRIAFCGKDGAIRVINRDGSNRKRVTHPPAREADWQQVWSPDGRMLAFSREGRIWVVNAGGTHERQLTR